MHTERIWESACILPVPVQNQTKYRRNRKPCHPSTCQCNGPAQKSLKFRIVCSLTIVCWCATLIFSPIWGSGPSPAETSTTFKPPGRASEESSSSSVWHWVFIRGKFKFRHQVNCILRTSTSGAELAMMVAQAITANTTVTPVSAAAFKFCDFTNIPISDPLMAEPATKKSTVE